ncbi:DUF72 domain-containing protein [Streptomyces sp. B93]|uniref:DUF72 domain-containing protein n=1 Tax=Streptomyces sp. B93 TaxID=2824875 RepID=UPI001B3922A2|nr:DUF72 domain-containing protein [Streptomyces sp. B93]MBQ1092038.1 DUF72 domain-containing protein [Streptomyces sp. B93]
MTLYVGTSGWQYKDWKGVLYPPDVPVRRWLEEYAAHFATVELNNAFYRLPTRENFEAWRERVPPDFVVAVKASRYLTHIKRLKDPEEPVHRLLSHASGLGDRLGPVLLQLPPTLRADAGLLDACLACFPPGVRVAVEPRHDSWWTPEVRRTLESRGAALCWADVLSRPVTPLWRTADWGYVRLHQGRASPWPRYGHRALHSWATRIAAAFPTDADVYTYFNNDPGGAAILDAAAFATVAAPMGLTATRTHPGARGTARQATTHPHPTSNPHPHDAHTP